MAQDNLFHQPALADEVADLMREVVPGVIIDATFGGGGHSRRLIAEFGADVEIIAIDRDPEAVANAVALGITAVQGNFGDLARIVAPLIEGPPSGILFDFGVSSRQLDTPKRGFSYHREGPLDMRMGPDARLTAAEIVNEWPIPDLAGVLRRYGEEPMADRIAAAIAAARPIETTSQLSTVIAEAMPAARRRAGHPARRVFQALRIAVNDELTAVTAGLDQAIQLLQSGGRVVAISYHSLEDRIVKTRFAAGATGCVCPPGLPVCGCGRAAELRLLTRKPIRARSEEVAANRRARSAKLRAAEKVAA
ncbi:MAG: 16S rRNA (cytosine(1402)-N(4))-methyltransferase RsmH [Actinobacteria bacterium]|nr:16S rRNA (cytosine(1402)-N(4))-methyltransferase RsmH [Actinomycetota bacterium]